MRRSFSKQEIQRWTLIDLNRWQECLVRQQLQFLGDSADEQRLEQEGDEQVAAPMRTSVVPVPLPSDGLELALPESHIVVFSVGAMDWLRTRGLLASSLAPASLRLVWDWGPSKLHSYRTAAGTGFHGVIRDPVSLRSWIRISFVAGGRSVAETHPILAKVSIPKLLTHDLRNDLNSVSPTNSRVVK